MVVHVLTGKNLMDESTNELIAFFKRYFWGAKFLKSLAGEEVYDVENFYKSSDKVPQSARTFKVPKEFKKFSFKEDILVKRVEAISQKERLGTSKQKAPLVFVNFAIPFSEVAKAYPNSAVLGYAQTPDEILRLRQAGGLENALFLGPVPNEQNNCSRFDYSYLHWIDFKGVVTTDNIDPLIAQNLRKRLLLYNIRGGFCGDCEPPRHYACVQAQILGIKSQKELKGEFPEEKLKILFGLDPLFDKVQSFSEFPIFGKIGPVCYQTLLDSVHGALGKISSERMCEGRTKHTEPAVQKFRQDYRTLCEKYGVSYPEK